MGEANRIRAFLAFDIPVDVVQQLKCVMRQMEEKAKGIKWVDPTTIHCTIKFFGEVDENLLLNEISTAIEKELRGKLPVMLECVGLGVFPNWRYPRVIWAGLVGDVYRIAEWHERMESVFEKFGIARDQRTFRMHLTLGRAKNVKSTGTLMKFVEKMVDKSFGAVEVNKLVLYKSRLTKSGPVYTVLREFPLSRERAEDKT